MNADAIFSFIREWFLYTLAFSGFITTVMIYMRIMSNATRDWPSAPGKIISSRIQHESSYSNKGAIPWVTYTYQVQGKTYKGGVIMARDIALADHAFVEKIVAHYPCGADVLVYYNPKDPSKAILEKQSETQTQMWSLLIGGNLLMPLIVLLTNFLRALTD